MLATADTFSLIGVEATRVSAEVDIHRGLPSFSVVGLPDAAVRESRERVRAAIVNTGFEFPLKRVTVNLAPADLRKAGPGFDLAIAAAILAASAQIPSRVLDRWALAGELALDGAIRPVRGALAMAERAASERSQGLAVAVGNAAEAALVDGVEVAGLGTLKDLESLAEGCLEPAQPSAPALPIEPDAAGPNLSELRGQPVLRRGLEVAAAGGHSMLIVGPPGAGKSLGARRLPSILPPLSREESIEVIRIASVAGTGGFNGAPPRRPFRAPHHTISAAGLVGGGTPPRPGELSLAHRGVLFLDELGEFSRQTLEALRQPLESGTVTIARARGALSFPAGVQLIAAANPCPCGHGEGSEACGCSPDQARRYRARLSGALADRIDITLAVEQPDLGALGVSEEEDSATVRARVVEARERQCRRLGPGLTNATMDDRMLRRTALLDADAENALARAREKLGLSGRGWARTARVARTCADLAALERVGPAQVAAALALRRREQS